MSASHNYLHILFHYFTIPLLTTNFGGSTIPSRRYEDDADTTKEIKYVYIANS